MTTKSSTNSSCAAGTGKSLEKMGLGLVFLVYQVILCCARQIRTMNLPSSDASMLRLGFFLTVIVVSADVLTLLIPRKSFSPVSSIARVAFGNHTTTGNPLVDSVADHQPSVDIADFRYLRHLYCSPFGSLSVLSHFDTQPLHTILVATWFDLFYWWDL